MSTQDIYNYRKVSDFLVTGGQPTEEQLRSAAQEGFKAVINLDTYNPERSLPDEAGLVRSLDMDYYHIPVKWDNPTLLDFDAFVEVIQKQNEVKTVLHCAANYRATAFYSLYAMQHLGWSEAEADAFMGSVWQGSYPVWEQFIRDVKDRRY